MSARTRLPRQAAQAAKYTFDEPSDDEPEDPLGATSSDEDARPAKKRKKGKAKAAGRKARLAAQEDEEEDEGRYIHVWIREPSPEKVEYEVKGVDFSKVLPVEVTVEILSSFHPKTLYSLSFLSKTFHAIITSASFRPILRRAFLFREKEFNPAHTLRAFFGFSDSDSDSEDEGVLQTQLPKVGAEEVEPYRLAMLLYEPSCQICRQTEGSTYDPHLLLRVCSACRRRNFKLISDVRKSDEIDYLHPSTLDAVITTARSVESPGSNGRERALYVPHLEAVSERLDELAHKGDDKKSTLPTGSSATSASQASDAMTTARRSTKRQAAQGSTSMRIQAFVRERKNMQKEGDDLAAWIRKYSTQLTRWLRAEQKQGRKAAERAIGLRWQNILNHIEEEGVFDYPPSDVWLEHRLKAHPLVKRTDSLIDEGVSSSPSGRTSSLMLS
ncbi:hypothetical protein AAT19DRAFT_12864 [Rhodotorula toruloides]|uniref:F-box domain-containing protein n=1 Tax=Rhodotorula toruloides TaxID=5286 RepID=A0A2T0ACV9_RHOTO|nr:hypothetical protein AAT19DRAFT_12864 [Rhodotorula toruloides]